jgi:hypothetical protein
LRPDSNKGQRNGLDDRLGLTSFGPQLLPKSSVSKATRVQVSISSIDRSRFGVEVIDNGSAPDPEAEPGYGTKVLNELSLKWERTRSGDTTRAYAEMVLPGGSV